jgi:hypothetical protein
MWDLNADPGEGNLNLRAFLASLVGPRRVAHGQRTVKRVPITGSAMLLRSTSTGKQATYFEVWLPQVSLALPGGGALLSFLPSDSGGPDNGYQITLTAFQRYSGVILGDDQLYAAALADAAGGALVAPVSVVVTSVVF